MPPIPEDVHLIAELERALVIARPIYDHIEREIQLGVWLEGDRNTAPAVEIVTEAISQHPEFRHPQSKMFHSKQLMIAPWALGYGLISEGFRNGAADAVAWLRRIYPTSRATIRYVAEVYGLEIDRELRMSNGVRILPLTAMPDSPNARAVMRQFEIRPGHSNPRIERPVVFVHEIADVRADVDDNRTGRSPTLDETVLAFTLVNGAAPVVGSLWIDFVDPDLAKAEFGRLWSSGRYDGRLPAIAKAIDDDAVGWAERFLAITDNELRGRCTVAAERLNLARRRLSPGDQAIDAGTCLEALFSDSRKEELSYKLRLRAALFLGETLARRREILREVKDLYSLRSTTVHGGTNRRHPDLPSLGIAQKGIDLCSAALRGMVLRNEVFDHETWELTGGNFARDLDE